MRRARSPSCSRRRISRSASVESLAGSIVRDRRGSDCARQTEIVDRKSMPVIQYARLVRADRSEPSSGRVSTRRCLVTATSARLHITRS